MPIAVASVVSVASRLLLVAAEVILLGIMYFFNRLFRRGLASPVRVQ